MSGDDENPFGAFPFLGDMMKALAGQGPLNWDVARQVAFMTAGSDTRNVDPGSRIAFEQLAPLAHRHVADLLSPAVDIAEPSIECMTTVQWCHSTLDAYRPIFDNLATALGRRTPADTDDPMSSLMGGLTGAMAPMMLGMTIGSMIGQMSLSAFGNFDLLLPRAADRPVSVVPANIEAFASDWSLGADEIRMWVLVHEMSARAVLSVAHVRTALLDAVNAYVAAFVPDPEAVIEKLSGLDVEASDPMAAIQRSLSDPAILLGAVISPAQQDLRPRLDALLAATVGLLDWVVDSATQRLLGGSPAISEALRRRRVEESPTDRLVEHLLGIHHTRATIERGRRFVAGVIERAAPETLFEMLKREDGLPTPAEVDAPGLWLARLGIDPTL